MTFAGYLRRISLSLAALSLSVGFAHTPAFAASYDGTYSVEILTDEGTCERVYRWSIAVTGGHITSTGDIVAQASGQIDSRGVVSVAFRHDDQVAHAAGRIRGTMGSGTWSAPGLQCGGRWRAERRAG